MPPPATWGEAGDHYQGTFGQIHHAPETQRIYAWLLEDFARNELGGVGTPLTSVTRETIEKYQARRVREGTSPATINKNVRHLAAFIRWCMERGWIASDPLRGIRKLTEVKRIRPSHCQSRRASANESISTLFQIAAAERLPPLGRQHPRRTP